MTNASYRRSRGHIGTRVVPVLVALTLAIGVAIQGIRAQGQPTPSSPAPTQAAPQATPATALVPAPVSAPSGTLPPPPPVPPGTLSVPVPQMRAATSFRFQIDPKTPVKDLLPTAPRVKNPTGAVLTDDLTQVPEVQFEAAKKSGDVAAARKHIAHQIAKINHLNSKKTDAFVLALREERADLNGLPMAMDEACRTRGERVKQFNQAVNTVRRALRGDVPGGDVLVRTTPAIPGLQFVSPPPPTANGGNVVVEERVVPAQTAPAPPPPVTGTDPVQPAFASAAIVARNAGTEQTVSADTFWDHYHTLCQQEERAQAGADRALRETIIQARIAALMQMLAPLSTSMRVGLVKYLTAVPHVDATRAIARLAIFCPEEEIRQVAVDALKVRREKDYTDILLQGLRYPWPAVARRASAVLVKLERTDVIPQLLDALEEPDPRAPVLKEINKKETPEVRELVRINHHQNCLLCHAPGNTANVPAEALTAGVPVPGEPLPVPSEGYNQSIDILVRLDVTYLRQDFSAMQVVHGADPWPEMQRFDFVVRARTLSEEEAKVYSETLNQREPGQQSPYRRAILTALRELTGKDAEPTPKAWRELLK